MIINIKAQIKKGFTLILTPILCSSLTACNSVSKKTYTSSLLDNEVIFYQDYSNYKEKNYNEIISMICNNHNLFQVEEILHYNIDTSEAMYAKRICYEALSKSFYESVKKGYDDYLVYKDGISKKYDLSITKYIDSLFYLYNRYLVAYKSDEPYEVVMSAIDISNKIKEVSIDDLFSIKFNEYINSETPILDASPLQKLVSTKNITSKSIINSEYNLLYIKYIFDILYRDYELDNGYIYQTQNSALDSMFIINDVITEEENNFELVEETTEVEDINNNSNYFMDSNGIIWNENIDKKNTLH